MQQASTQTASTLVRGEVATDIGVVCADYMEKGSEKNIEYWNKYTQASQDTNLEITFCAIIHFIRFPQSKRVGRIFEVFRVFCILVFLYKAKKW